MRIEIEVQYDKLGDDFLKDKKVMIEIHKSPYSNYLMVEKNCELMFIPMEALTGVLGTEDKK